MRVWDSILNFLSIESCIVKLDSYKCEVKEVLFSKVITLGESVLVIICINNFGKIMSDLVE